MLLDAIQGELDHAQELLDTAARRVEQLGVIQQHAHNLSNTVSLLQSIAPDLSVRVQELRDALDQVDGVGEGADTSTALPTQLAVPAGEPSPPMPVAVGALPPAIAAGSAAGSPAGPEAGLMDRRNGADAPDGPGGLSGSGPSTGGRPNRAKAATRDARTALLDVFEERDEATTSELIALSGLHTNTVKSHIKTLTDEGVLVVTGTREPSSPFAGRPPRIYALKTVADQKAARLGGRGSGLRGGVIKSETEASRRTYVLECIREGAGLVDEPEIAAQLDMNREHVADATGQLLEEGAVQLNPDGTYTATGGGSK